ncbi:MAG TPA: Stf0 family sulfotransferase [Ktedonobacteraceae bacterium]|nr:Stf0 family sulfotransferase [Ktedonobacteraceae bacterium]
MQPHTSYLICATFFSGSALLSKVLSSTGAAGRPKEYFMARRNVHATTFQQHAAHSGSLPPFLCDEQGQVHVDSLAHIFEQGTTANGIFGANVMWDYFDDFICDLRRIPHKEIPVVDLLPAVFPNLHYIWVTRRNKVRQAVSLWKAVQEWTWNKERPLRSANRHLLSERKLVFNFEAIDALVRRILADEADWQMYFDICGISPITVVYEELEMAPEAMARSILHGLHIPVPDSLAFSHCSTKRLVDTLSMDWAQRYTTLKRQQENGVVMNSPNSP